MIFDFHFEKLYSPLDTKTGRVSKSLSDIVDAGQYLPIHNGQQRLKLLLDSFEACEASHHCV